MFNWLRRAILGLALTAICVTSGYSDEPAVRKTIEDYVKSFNEERIDDVLAFWVEEAVHHDRETGERTEGRDAIAEDLRAALKDRKATRLSGTIERIQFITPDVAKVEGETLLSETDEEPSRTAFSAILVKKDGKWRFNTIEEGPVAVPPTAYDALQEISWLVGRWSDQGEEQSVETEIDWTPGGNFLIRSYVIVSDGVETAQGTQVIGWDPREQAIRSWSFNSDGSFGDGDWSRNGDHWLIRSSQTLADGQAASGTYVLTQQDDGSVRLRLIGHEIEGEPQPSRDAVVMSRVKEPESGDSASADTEAAIENLANEEGSR